MAQSSWFQQTPPWVFVSFIPGIGGLGIAYAGIKTKTPAWIALGVGFTLANLLLFTTPFHYFISGAQIGLAFYLKNKFLAKTYPKDLPITGDLETVRLIASNRRKLDINTCSKNELVNALGLPIVYANDIESLRNEGYLFTHIEELGELIGISEDKLRQIEPLIMFCYDSKKDAQLSWQRINTHSVQQLIACGLEPDIAQAIAQERQKAGEFRSPMEVKRRTGLPFSTYRQLM